MRKKWPETLTVISRVLMFANQICKFHEQLVVWECEFIHTTFRGERVRP